jgi:hypothetical protein
MGDGDVNFPKFTPMPSLAHELGVMFGFIAACLFTMGLYFVLWQSELSTCPIGFGIVLWPLTSSTNQPILSNAKPPNFISVSQEYAC